MLVHGSCVSVKGRGLLILGPSGCGKSTLALQMIALGAHLLSDDGVELSRTDDALIARAPPAIAGLIEARGIGLLRAQAISETPVVLAVDLRAATAERLPPRHTIVFLEKPVDLVNATLEAHLPAALMVYLQGGRAA